LCGGKTRPVAGGRENFHHDQPVRRKPGRQHIVNLPRGIAAAANLDTHLLRRHQVRGKFFLGFGVAKGKIARAIRGDREFRLNRQIQRVRQPVEHGCALAKVLPLAARARH
jgi:hypothetical protein